MTATAAPRILGITHCMRCNRILSNPESVARGIGPVCIKKLRPAADADGVQDHPLLDGNPRVKVICKRVPTGRPLYPSGEPQYVAATNMPQLVVHHSPDGFEWGYPGSGPSDFALNILHLYIPPKSDNRPVVRLHRGKCSWTAYHLYQEFKREFIASMPHEGGEISAAEIEAWILIRKMKIETEEPAPAWLLPIDEA